MNTREDPLIIKAKIIGRIIGRGVNIFVTSNLICWLLGIGTNNFFINFLLGLLWLWALLSIVQVCYEYIKVLERH